MWAHCRWAIWADARGSRSNINIILYIWPHNHLVHLSVLIFIQKTNLAQSTHTHTVRFHFSRGSWIYYMALTHSFDYINWDYMDTTRPRTNAPKQTKPHNARMECIARRTCTHKKGLPQSKRTTRVSRRRINSRMSRENLLRARRSAKINERQWAEFFFAVYTFILYVYIFGCSRATCMMV